MSSDTKQSHFRPEDIMITLPNGASVKRITKPYGRDLEQFYRMYRETFPIRDEREPQRSLQAIARGIREEGHGRMSEGYLVGTNVNEQMVGGNMFDYVEGKKIAFGVDWYLFIGRNNRREELGTLTHEASVDILQKKAQQRGHPGLDLMICELNDPTKMTPEDVETDRKVMDPTQRIEFWDSLGYRAIDPRFRYAQPQITKDTKPYEMILAVKPLTRELKHRIPIEYLKQLLWLSTWGGFEGIPGSDINGYRNPDTDRTYQDMKRQLELMEKSRSYLQLVPLVKNGD